KGVEVILNEALNVVDVLDQDVVGEVTMVKQLLGDDRAVLIGRGDDEMVAMLSSEVRGALRAGDPVLYDPRSGYALEALPKEEVEEVILEEIPDITYEQIGGLSKQIEDIRDAVELPFLYAELFAEHQLQPPKGVLLYGPPGCGKTLIAKAVANSLAQQVAEKSGRKDAHSYFLNIKGPELLNKYVGETERQIRLIFQRAKDGAVHDSELESAGGRERAVRRMIDATIDQMYATTDDNRFLEVTYQSGDKEVLYFKDFNSGAMIENIVRRAKKMAIKRFLSLGEKGLKLEDLVTAIRDEFKENEDLPNTTNPDDWARISGKKGRSEERRVGKGGR